MGGGTPAEDRRSDLAVIIERTRRLYAARVARLGSAPPWWTAVIITASSKRQAERYEWELHRRAEKGTIPRGTRYLVVPDRDDRRIGSGSATLNAVRTLAVEMLLRNSAAPPSTTLREWWSGQRVLMIHSGGDSRRLPQYSLSGKLFSAVPVATPWGDASTVFDEMLALSTSWVERLHSGLVVGSGDVVLTFDADALHWEQDGVNGVAMRQPAETGTRHGVYVTDGEGRVYAFLQKPSLSDLAASGALLEDGQVALDTGLLYFDAEVATRLTELAGVTERDGKTPAIDLYAHFTMALTGQWKPGPSDAPALHALFDVLRGIPFRCSLVSGDFTHVGTTSLFRQLMTGGTEFSRLCAVQKRLGVNRQPGVRSAGVVIDSVLSGGADLGADSVVIECNLESPVRAGAGSVLHGLDGISGMIEVPEDAVIHQIPVVMPDGRRGIVMRSYGVEDDPKAPVTADSGTWFGRPMLEDLRTLGMDPDQVWPGLAPHEWALWNAQLFPVTTTQEAMACARWQQRLPGDFSAERWRKLDRVSLAASARLADASALEAARSRRLNATWKILAVSLVESGCDIRPLLANAPQTGTLAETAATLRLRAGEIEASSPTEAASRHYVAGLFFGQAGLAEEADESNASAFRLVERAVEMGNSPRSELPNGPWRFDEVTVEGPARIDLAGGWSDTPPFCIDWGGTVLNIGVLVNGCYPIRTTIRRLPEPLVRCISSEDGAVAEYRSSNELLQAPRPGDQFSIPRTALRMTGMFREEASLAETLKRKGGGIEIRMAVDLPMGSGLGTSSILAATTLRALSELTAASLDDRILTEQVMQLEQMMTTGGGWQDQVGGIYPGAKLAMTGPGLYQRVRVQPVSWSSGIRAEFESRIVLYYTGLRRVARDLLRQVVGRYLARETACIQVLHSMKTLAAEMAYAMREGDWDHLGTLLNRQWELNLLLDPNTTNAPINRLLEQVRPFIRGVKLAGAGGGGFLILLARSPAASQDLREFLSHGNLTDGAIYQCQIADQGLRLRGQ